VTNDISRQTHIQVYEVIIKLEHKSQIRLLPFFPLYLHGISFLKTQIMILLH
jgi:hypothetical protein